MKITKKLRNLSFIIIIIVLCLLVLEISLKIFLGLIQSTDTLILTGDDRIYDHRPSIVNINRHGIKVSYNSLGFIGEDVGQKQNDAFRILALGDSITDATYFPEQFRYLSILKEILNRKLNKRIEIINGSVGGYNTWQELALFKKKGLQLNPDLVIVGICLNDSVKSSPDKYIYVLGKLVPFDIRDGSKARYFNFVYQHSSLYKIIYDGISSIIRNAQGEIWYNNYVKNYNFSISEDEFKEWLVPLRAIVEICSKNNIKVLFVIFPLHSQLARNNLTSCKPLKDFMKDNKINSLDLIDIYRPYYREGFSLYRDRDLIHPNITGHKVTAEAIAQYLIDNDIIK